MGANTSLKRFVLLWSFFLAFCLFGLLSYQSTRSFLRAIDFSTQKHLYDLRNELKPGEVSRTLGNGYHISSSWEAVPEEVRQRFLNPPTQHNRQLRIFEDWIYFAPPGKSFRLMLSETDDGKTRYLSSVMYFDKSKKEMFEKQKHSVFIDPMVEIALWGVLALIVFMIAVFLMLRAIVKPVHSLQHWAKSQNMNTINEPLPNLRFSELNELALLYHQGLRDLSQSLANEKEFLQFASHELRTPLTVLNSNISLLAKLKPEDLQKNEEVRARIFRASQSMRGITETLLWLYRSEGMSGKSVPVSIPPLLQETIDNLRYLLVGKDIQVKLEAEPGIEYLPMEAFSILLNNLIRNAFQHTDSGNIDIRFSRRCLCVSNPMGSDSIGQQGFGLGLKLVNALASKFSWTIERHEKNGIFKVYLRF